MKSNCDDITKVNKIMYCILHGVFAVSYLK